MFAVRIRGALTVAALAAAAACGSSEPSGPSTSTPSAIGRVSGNGQVGLVGTSLSLPLIVKVTGTSGTPIKGASVTFAVTSGAATLSPTTATTDSLGQAKTQVTLGSAVASFSVTSHGATALTTASLAPSLDVTPLSPIGEYRTNNVQTAFDARLREIARRELTPRIPAAQQWNRQRPSFAAIPANP